MLAIRDAESRGSNNVTTMLDLHVTVAISGGRCSGSGDSGATSVCGSDNCNSDNQILISVARQELVLQRGRYSFSTMPGSNKFKIGSSWVSNKIQNSDIILLERFYLGGERKKKLRRKTIGHKRHLWQLLEKVVRSGG